MLNKDARFCKFSFSERNLNPKAACLKRREDEKSEDIPGRPMNVNAEDLQQGSMGPKVL